MEKNWRHFSSWCIQKALERMDARATVPGRCTVQRVYLAGLTEWAVYPCRLKCLWCWHKSPYTNQPSSIHGDKNLFALQCSKACRWHRNCHSCRPNFTTNSWLTACLSTTRYKPLMLHDAQQVITIPFQHSYTDYVNGNVRLCTVVCKTGSLDPVGGCSVYVEILFSECMLGKA